jgi:hypothetical protein
MGHTTELCAHNCSPHDKKQLVPWLLLLLLHGLQETMEPRAWLAACCYGCLRLAVGSSFHCLSHWVQFVVCCCEQARLWHGQAL